MKAKSIALFLILLSLPLLVRAAATNAAGDSIKVVDKTFFGRMKSPGSKKVGNVSLTIEVEATLKSVEAATLRVGATVDSDREMVTLFTRSIKEGRLKTEIPVSISAPKGKSLIVVVWIDPNPEETKSPPRPIVFDKFGFDLSAF